MASTQDVISPLAFLLVASFGYSIFAVAWIFLAYAVMRGLLDLVEFAEGRRRFSPVPEWRSAFRETRRSRHVVSRDVRSRKVLLFSRPAKRQVSRD